MLYYGPHLHAALICLRGGYPENAASWMFMDLGEALGSDDEAAHPDLVSLREVEGGIEYDPVWELRHGVAGDGI
jgi:hypothetical protein